MGLFNDYILTEAGLSPSDKSALDRITKDIQLVDKQIQAGIGPVGKGKFMITTGDAAGHLNDQNPLYKALVAKRQMLVAKRMKIMSKSEITK